MKYAIEIYYATGNSFGSEDLLDKLELMWNNLDVAKLNLKRIEDHYRWYNDQNSYSFNKKNIEKPEWHIFKEDFMLSLITDEGNEMQLNAFWCGHFEALHSAEIVTLQDNDLKVTF